MRAKAIGKYYLFLLALFCGTLILQLKTSAQKVNIEHTFKHYTIHDGLAQMQVMSLYQDTKGFLWCYTKAGVSRFDGRNFKNYSQNKIGLNGDYYVSFGEDYSGNLLLFSARGITRLEIDSFVYHKFPNDLYLFNRVNNYSINKSQIVVQDENNYGLKILDHTNLDSMVTVKCNNKLGSSIFIDKPDEDLIWHINSDSIYVTNSEVVKRYKNPGKIDHLKRMGGAIYGISDNSGIYRFDGNEFKLVVKTNFDNRYFKVIRTPDNKAFIIKTDKDLYYYKDKLVPIKRDLAFIRDILFDNENNLWVATEEGLYNFFQLNFTNYTFGKGNKDWVWSVIEDDEKNMWFASYQNGIWKWDGNKTTDYSNQINSKFKSDLKNTTPYAKYRYYMGASKYNSTLYFPTECNVLKYDGSNFSVVDGLINSAYEITKTVANGAIYIGGVAGLYRKKTNGEIDYFSRDTLGVSNVLNVEIDKNDRTLVLGKDGISVIDNDSIIYFDKKQRYCCTKDRKNNIWIGGISTVNLFSGDSVIDVFANEQEAFYSILFVEPNYLLLGGLKGLYVVNLNDYYNSGVFELLLFDQHSGFTGVECGQNGFFTDSEGMVWLPTSDLVCRFDPQKLFNKKINSPKLFVGTEVSEDNINWNVIDTNNEIKLKYFFNNIRFKTDAISFANIASIRYYYRLKGLQSNWSEATETDEISYYNLKPGQYEFMVKADPGIRKAISKTVSIKFTIGNPFWLKWWFFLFALFFLILFVIFVVKFFSRRVQKKELIKKRIVQLRSEALKSQMNPHLIQNALNNINGLINLGRSDEAQNFLSSFSKMLRLVLNNVSKDEITLAEELKIIKSFVQFHSHANEKSINFNINNQLLAAVDSVLIPPMLVQPYIENAILHGIAQLKEREGKIEIEIKDKDDRLIVTITDNGVGLGNSERKGTGLGTKLTNERIQLLEKNSKNSVQIIKLVQGTKVVINIPLKIEPNETSV
jgi:ligand-binding sensor domain-containing protein/two-component sensor histidine kinase